jgi:hypothetical protein
MKGRPACHGCGIRVESSKDDGMVGGDSPVKLMRFPGDPASPALAHSFVMLGIVVSGTGRASRVGEIVVAA